MPKANILPDQVLALARVIKFAQENGFPNASELFWDENNLESGMPSLSELVSEVNEEYRIRLGVDLGGPHIIAVREWDSENDDETEIIFRHNAPAPKRKANAVRCQKHPESWIGLNGPGYCQECARDGDPEDTGEVAESEVTWCREKIFAADVEYIRADRVNILLQALHGIAMPCTRSDYTVGKLDAVVCEIAQTALDQYQHEKSPDAGATEKANG